MKLFANLLPLPTFHLPLRLPTLHGKNVTFLLVVAALISAIVTYVAITQNSTTYGPDPSTVLGLVLVNLLLLLGLVAAVTRSAFRLWAEFRRGSVGSRLQTRVVLVFSLVTIIPTVIVSVFSILFFNFGIQSWFDARVSSALEESVAVAEAYLVEHKEVIRADALAMANDLNRQADDLFLNPRLFNKVVDAQATLRSLTEAVVFQRGRILARSQFSFSLAFEKFPQSAIEEAAGGDVVILTDEDDRVRALVKLDSFVDTYLLVGRFVDSKVLAHMEKTQGGVNEYLRLKSRIADLQVKYSFAFVVVSILLLVVALWYGMIFAGNLVKPLSNLIAASERIRAGDYAVKVAEGPKGDEIGALARAFNRMAERLEEQRRDLVSTNRMLDERRRFTEMVLAGVSAGVLAFDTYRNATLSNRSACTMLGLADGAKGNVAAVFPEIEQLLAAADRQPDQAVQENLVIQRQEKTLTLHVRIGVEKVEGHKVGYVVTFDDITGLISAQRNAAWADVARRVAHEIKNPLTPIHLATERLRRKYGDQVEKDKEQYFKYLETITRHVEDIGRIVEEFIAFARMPTPVFKQEDIGELLRKAVFSIECAWPEIRYELELPEAPATLSLDGRLMGQVFTNLLKNAGESVLSSKPAGGRVRVSLRREPGGLVVEIADNGKGFPPELLNRLTEPYVTTKEKGTGLGLAIVKKIVEDHKARLSLENLAEGGALVRIVFPV